MPGLHRVEGRCLSADAHLALLGVNYSGNGILGLRKIKKQREIAASFHIAGYNMALFYMDERRMTGFRFRKCSFLNMGSMILWVQTGFDTYDMTGRNNCKGETFFMKNERFERYIYMGVTAILVLIAAVFVVFLFLERNAVFAFLGKVRFVLAPVIYGAVLAFLMSPVYNWCYNTVVYVHDDDKGKEDEEKKIAPKKRFKSESFGNFLGKAVGTVVSLAFLIAVVVSLSSMIIPQLYSSIVGIINMMPVYFQNVYDWLTEFFVNNPPVEQAILNIYEQSAQYFQSWMETDLMSNLSNFQNFQNIEKIVGGVSSGVMNVITLTKNMLIGLIVMIYLLNIKESLSAQGKKFIYSVLPLKAANIVVAEFQFIKKAFSGFIIGKLIDSLIIGILCFILMHLFKLPYELLISVIIGVTNIIPFFGPFIGAVPCAILVFLISPKQCLYFIGLILVLQQFDGNILGPKILGNSTGVSSFGVLFSILLFGGLCGFVGMIIAVPLMAVIIHIYNQIQEYLLSKKSLSIKEEDYVNLKRIDEQSGEYKKHSDEQ